MSFLNAVMRRIRAVAAVVVLAALVGLALALVRPAEFASTATVFVPLGAVNQPFNVVSQTVANFQGAVRSDAVAVETAGQTGVSRGKISGGLSVSRVGTSNVVEVTYVGTDAETARTVVDTQSRNALSFIVESNLQPAAAELELSEEAFDQAQSDIAEFKEENDLVIPEQEFRQAQGRIIDLKNQLGAAGNDPELAERIEEITDRYIQQITTYEGLLAARERARTALLSANSRFADAQGQIQAAKREGVVRTTDAVQRGRLPILIRQVLASAAFGLLLGVGLTLLLEALTPSRRRAFAARRRRGVVERGRPRAGAQQAATRRARPHD